jgi:hypothetical protein
MIEDGTPFCQTCGAPQIRVALPEADTTDVSTPHPVPITEFRTDPAPPPSSIGLRFQWRLALRPILMGGVIILVGSMVPLGGLWHVLVIVAGAMAAVALYQRQPLTSGEVPTGTGAKIGIAAALSTYTFYVLLIILGFAFAGPEVRQQVILRVQETQAQFTDPQSRAAAQTLLQQMSTPEGFATIVTLGMALLLIFFLVFGATGGALGAQLFGRNRNRR